MGISEGDIKKNVAKWEATQSIGKMLLPALLVIL